MAYVVILLAVNPQLPGMHSGYVSQNVLSPFSIVVLADSSTTVPISISCKTYGDGPDVEEIFWSHESVDTAPVSLTKAFFASNPRITQEANRLIFSNVDISDDGLYVCYFRRQGQDTFQRSDSGCVYVLGEYSLTIHDRTTLLKMDRYYNMTMRHYWHMLVK